MGDEVSWPQVRVFHNQIVALFKQPADHTRAIGGNKASRIQAPDREPQLILRQLVFGAYV